LISLDFSARRSERLGLAHLARWLKSLAPFDRRLAGPLRACALVAPIRFPPKMPRNAAAGNKAILKLCARLRATACENPDPHVVSRAQFVPVARSALAGLSEAAAHAAFSAFDPEVRASKEGEWGGAAPVRGVCGGGGRQSSVGLGGHQFEK